MLISSRSVNKHGSHRQFLFVVGWFLKIFSSETASPNEMSPTPQSQSCPKCFFFNFDHNTPKIIPHRLVIPDLLNLKKIKWQVSNTDSAHWTSSYVLYMVIALWNKTAFKFVNFEMEKTFYNRSRTILLNHHYF